MKRIFTALLCVVMIFSLAACGGETVSKHSLTYISGEQKQVPFNDEKLNCVAIYTEYTNNSGETAVPADEVSVKAYQNGVELSPWVFTGEEMDGYTQCDSSIQNGTTAQVVWFFELSDSSDVSVELTGNDNQTISVK